VFLTLIEWLEKSSPITWIVIGVLSFYLFLTLWVFLYRWVSLHKWFLTERDSANMLLKEGSALHTSAFLSKCKHRSFSQKALYEGCLNAATKESTSGLTLLSIIASTSPFIGLFGTVVGILESFAGFKEGVTLTIIAPAISEALVATAFGILVAIPAYSFHLILKRKAFEITSYITMQATLLASKNEQ